MNSSLSPLRGQRKIWGFITTNLDIRGFTLVELLVVISILAIISAIGIVSYSQAQLVGRDAKRKQDLRAIEQSLSLYYQTNKRYPCKVATPHQSSVDTNPFWIQDPDGVTVCGSSTQIPLDSNYIASMPLDPINSGNPSASSSNYGYSYNGASANCSAAPGQSFVLRAVLENGSDQEACKVKRYKRCDGTDYCTGGAGDADNNLFIITSQ